GLTSGPIGSSSSDRDASGSSAPPASLDELRARLPEGDLAADGEGIAFTESGAEETSSSSGPTGPERAVAGSTSGETSESESLTGASLSTAISTGPSGGLLWGAAALAVASATTAYALARRQARQAQTAAMRREAAAASSPKSRISRIQSLTRRLQARAAPIRAAMVAAAAAKAAQEAQRRQKVAYRLAQYRAQLERLGPPTTPFGQMVAWQEPSPALTSTQVIARYYLSERGSVPSPGNQTVAETPGPSVTPSPVRVPYPQVFQPLVEPWPRVTGGALVDGAGYLWRYGRTGHKIYNAWPLRFVPLESGKVGVRVGDLVPSGEKLARRLKLEYPGTRYNVGTLGRVTSGNLIRGAARNAGMAIPLFTTLAANIYEFGWGSQRGKGIWSNEFAA
ncbi:MAG: hypothetical protein ACRDHG_02105, partial [Anaerolineales bacterium]